jgi:hypothetical protein
MWRMKLVLVVDSSHELLAEGGAYALHKSIHWLAVSPPLGGPQSTVAGAIWLALALSVAASICRCTVKSLGSRMEGGSEDESKFVCSICRDDYWEADNEIVLCDGGCELATHCSCYGILAVPEGEWKCRSCAVGVKPTCALCGHTGGLCKPLYKAGTSGSSAPTGWVHMLCALTNEGVTFEHQTLLEPIVLAANPPTARKKACKCSLCGGAGRAGDMLKCAAPGCRDAFHAVCGSEQGLRIDLTSQAPSAAAERSFFCGRHQALAGANARSDGFAEADVIGLFNGVGVCNLRPWLQAFGPGSHDAEDGGDAGRTGGSAAPRSNRALGAAGASSAASDSGASAGGRPGAFGSAPATGDAANFASRVNMATVGKLPHKAGYAVRRAILPEYIAEAAASAAGTDREVEGSATDAFRCPLRTHRAILACIAVAFQRHERVMGALQDAMVLVLHHLQKDKRFTAATPPAASPAPPPAAVAALNGATSGGAVAAQTAESGSVHEAHGVAGAPEAPGAAFGRMRARLLSCPLTQSRLQQAGSVVAHFGSAAYPPDEREAVDGTGSRFLFGRAHKIWRTLHSKGLDPEPPQALPAVARSAVPAFCDALLTWPHAGKTVAAAAPQAAALRAVSAAPRSELAGTNASCCAIAGRGWAAEEGDHDSVVGPGPVKRRRGGRGWLRRPVA